MKLILQSIKTLLRKYVKTVNGIAPDDTGNVEINTDKWQNYDLVICLSNKGTTVGEIVNTNAPHIVKGDYESVKNTLTDCGTVRVYLFAYQELKTQEYKLDYIFFDEDDYFVLYVYKNGGSGDFARMYLSPRNTVSIVVEEWQA